VEITELIGPCSDIGKVANKNNYEQLFDMNDFASWHAHIDFILRSYFQMRLVEQIQQHYGRMFIAGALFVRTRVSPERCGTKMQ